jgi:hypothetical protein
LPLELAVLETVQYLFERELHARQNGAMRARKLVRGYRTSGKWKDCGAGRDEERYMGDYETKPEDPACRRSHGRQDAAHPNASRPARMNVSVEPHDRS